MKKITLLLLAFFIGQISKAQSVVWTDDFNDEDISDWTLIDSDGDANNWGDLFFIGTSGGSPVTPVSLISRSWQGAPLTPDNWAISPAIDLSGASGTITVDWITQVAAASWDEEKYSVHVGTSSDISVLINATNSLTEVLGDLGNTGTPTPKSLDISSLAGESAVYIAFRHWDVTDQDFISIDDVTVNAATLSTEEFSAKVFSYNYNKNLKVLNIDILNNSTTSVDVYSLLGQKVLSQEISPNNSSVNVSSLNDGVYLAKIVIKGNSETIKFIKN